MANPVQGTLFAAWYNQQIANRAAQQAQDTQNAELVDRGMVRNRAQHEENNQQLAAEAAVAGKQATELDQPAPQFEEPRMAVAAQMGGKDALIGQLVAARAARAKMEEERFKQQGALGLEGVRQEGGITKEGMGNASSERNAQTSANARIEAARIAASKPSMGIMTKRSQAADAASDMRNVIGKLRAMRPDGNFSDLLEVLQQARGGAADLAEKWGVGGVVPNEWHAKNAEQKKFEELAGLLNIEQVHKYFGGALTPQEMKRADAVMINARMSPTHFAAALNEMEALFAKVEARANGGSEQTSIQLGGSAVPTAQALETIRVKMPDGTTARVRGNAEDFLRDHPGASIVK